MVQIVQMLVNLQGEVKILKKVKLNQKQESKMIKS